MIKVSCAIIVQNNKILVAQRNSSSGNPLKWEFPGGKQMKGETIKECLAREIYEELDIQLKIIEKLTPVIHKYEFGKIKLKPFICTILSGQIKLREHHDIKWITLENLSDVDFTPADKKLIEMEENKLVLKKYIWKNMHNP